MVPPAPGKTPIKNPEKQLLNEVAREPVISLKVIQRLVSGCIFD